MTHRIYFKEISIRMSTGGFKFYQVTMSYLRPYPSDVHFVSIKSTYVWLAVHNSSRCRGLKVLVDLLDEDYSEQTELVEHALNGIGSVFELQSPTTKNDFCRMFIREGLLDPLSAALLNVMAIRDTPTMETKMKVIQILLVFSQVSQSDIHVRNALGTRKVVRRESINVVFSQ